MEFTCKQCGFRRLNALKYYRDDSLCGFCGHVIEYGMEAKRIKDLVPITRLITKVVIEEGDKE
jgi:hypothetical protein